MGSNSGSNSGGNTGPANRYKTPAKKNKKPADYNPEKDDTAAKLDMFKNQGATNIKNSKFKTPATMILTKPLQAGSKVTRDFFTDKVLGSKNYKGTTKEDFSKLSRSAQESMYKDYSSSRLSGKTDAYGNTISQGGNDNNGNQVVQAPTVTGPTTAEVSQVTATPEVTAEEARATANELIRKKRRGRGRSLMIATSSQGAKDEGLTLSSKTLLG
jgi:hypothetical protein